MNYSMCNLIVCRVALHSNYSTHAFQGCSILIRGVDNFFDVGGLTSSHASKHINLRYFVCILGAYSNKSLTNLKLQQFLFLSFPYYAISFVRNLGGL